MEETFKRSKPRNTLEDKETLILGKGKTKEIKRISRKLIKQYPKRFSRDFNSNKKVLGVLGKISSKKLRNYIAGYISHLIKITENSGLKERKRNEKKVKRNKVKRK